MPSTINTGSVDVNNITAPVLIVPARVGRLGLKLYVQGGANSFITIGASGAVTTATGYPIPIGEYTFNPVTEGDIYGLGTNMVVKFLETF